MTQPSPPYIKCRVVFAFILWLTVFQAHADDDWTGADIMGEVFNRHEVFPYVYEEQTQILTDKSGNQDVRKIRRYSRVESDSTLKYLLVFDTPSEIQGVALRVVRHHSGEIETGVYLPAFGKEVGTLYDNNPGNHFLGTDFALEDLMEHFISVTYVRQPDQKINKRPYFIVDVFPADAIAGDNLSGMKTAYQKRRHFIQQDNFFITRTDFYNRRGQFFKRLTHHDLIQINDRLWRANMVLMENIKAQHKTLIKINKRVFSHDYVLPEMFTKSWLQENRHVRTADNDLGNELGNGLEIDGINPDDEPGSQSDN